MRSKTIQALLILTWLAVLMGAAATSGAQARGKRDDEGTRRAARLLLIHDDFIQFDQDALAAYQEYQISQSQTSLQEVETRVGGAIDALTAIKDAPCYHAFRAMAIRYFQIVADYIAGIRTGDAVPSDLVSWANAIRAYIILGDSLSQWDCGQSTATV